MLEDVMIIVGAFTHHTQLVLVHGSIVYHGAAV